jgi:hypothetical protein
VRGRWGWVVEGVACGLQQSCSQISLVASNHDDVGGDGGARLGNTTGQMMRTRMAASKTLDGGAAESGATSGQFGEGGRAFPACRGALQNISVGSRLLLHGMRPHDADEGCTASLQRDMQHRAPGCPMNR